MAAETHRSGRQLAKRWVALAPPGRRPLSEAPEVSRLAISSSFFRLEAPFCAAVGQRTRGRRSKLKGHSLRNIEVKLVVQRRLRCFKAFFFFFELFEVIRNLYYKTNIFSIEKQHFSIAIEPCPRPQALHGWRCDRRVGIERVGHRIVWDTSSGAPSCSLLLAAFQ